MPSCSSDYALGDFLFVSPRGRLLGRDEAFTILHSSAPLLERVANLFAQAADQGHKDAVMMGAIPFNTLQPSRLCIPSQLMRQPSPARQTLAEIAIDNQAERYRALPHEADYCAAVKQALSLFEETPLSKVVLARTLELQLTNTLDIPSLLRRLQSANTQGYTFAVPLQHPGMASTSTNTFLGASPELLVQRSGLTLLANPLAGSAPRRSSPEADQQTAQALLSSKKDLREHAIVVEAVAEALLPWCTSLDVPAQPTLVATDALWHLSTTITGKIRDRDCTSLQLALALHPTPAVCGTPSELAVQTIGQLEPFDRGYFAGMVGWCNTHGDGEWAVALRCAQCQDRQVRLYAGAGIIHGSIPEKERDETANKFLTMLGAMGMESALGRPN